MTVFLTQLLRKINQECNWVQYTPSMGVNRYLFDGEWARLDPKSYGNGTQKSIIRNRASDKLDQELIEDSQKLDDLVKGNRVLYKISSVFPFDFFPDKIIIDPIKINVVFKEFFSSERVHGIYIRNISDVYVDTGPIFATLKIIDQGIVENTVIVNYLKKNEALKAREIIQGLIVANRHGIDVSAIDDTNLVSKLVSLGEA